MEFRRCQPPCARFIAREDPHSKCIKCLGFSHARDGVYRTSKCKICDDFRLITLRSRLEDCERESSIFPQRASSTSAAPREIAASREAATWGSDVELEEMESEQTGLAFSLPPSPERARANSHVKFLHDFLFPSPKARDFVSFGLDDILHTAASDSEDFGPALADALPPSGQEARPSAAYSELVDVLSSATEKLALDWPDEPRESRASKLDERFLSGAHSKPERRKLPFFSDLHREISSSWKQPFSSRLTNGAAADFTNLVGSVEQGYTAMPVIEDTLASHLSPSLAPSWKSRPFLPSKPCRTTSALIGKSYIMAGQAGMALHTMAILQAYQADVLKEMDEGTGLTPEAVKELQRVLGVLGANSPIISAYLGDSDQAGLIVPASGQDLASSTRTLEVVGMAHTGPRAVIDGLPAEVQETIASARAPATRKLYSSVSLVPGCLPPPREELQARCQ